MEHDEEAPKNILSLPDELLIKIFSHVTQADIESSVFLTCKRFNAICDTPVLWRKLNVGGMLTTRERLRGRLSHARDLIYTREETTIPWDKIDFEYAVNLKAVSAFGGDVTSLNFLRYLAPLWYLNISFSDFGSEHLASLGHCPDLLIMQLCACKLNSLDSMPFMSRLLLLDLHSTNISNDALAVLERAPFLRMLNLSWCWRLNGLTGLPPMKHLRELDFSDIYSNDDRTTSFEFLSNCPNLVKFTSRNGRKFDTHTLPGTLNSIENVYISLWRETTLGDYTLDDFFRVCQSATNIKHFHSSFANTVDSFYAMAYAEGKFEAKILVEIVQPQ